MDEMLMSLIGSNGQIELYEDRVIIKRKGLSAKLSFGFFKKDKTIMLDQISEIKLKEAKERIIGYIRFYLKGEEVKRVSMVEASSNENAVTLKAANMEDVRAMKEKIEELQSQNVKNLIE